MKETYEQRRDEWVEGMKGEPQKPWKGGLLSGRTREALQRRWGFTSVSEEAVLWKNRKGLLVSSACAESELQKGHKSVAWEMEYFQHDWGGICIRWDENLKRRGCNGLACHDKGLGKWGQHKSLSRWIISSLSDRIPEAGLKRGKSLA